MTIDKFIGNTPLVRLQSPRGTLYGKLESRNPGGSVKDRIARNIIERAEEAGEIRPGGTIIEATSGNTGIGLAMVGAAKGYKVVLTMPDTMSTERRNLLKAYGATLELTPGSEGMKGAIKRAEELLASTENAFMANQFSNPSNPEAHYKTTGPEILETLGGDLDVFIAGVGTGGTITGTGTYLKEHKKEITLVAVEPKNSPVLSGGSHSPHKIQGIGAGFVPEVLKTELLDEIIQVTDEDAIQAAKELGQEQGIFVGISAGAAYYAAKEILQEGQVGVVILPDTGERYLSTALLEE